MRDVILLLRLMMVWLMALLNNFKISWGLICSRCDFYLQIAFASYAKTAAATCFLQLQFLLHLSRQAMKHLKTKALDAKLGNAERHRRRATWANTFGSFAQKHRFRTAAANVPQGHNATYRTQGHPVHRATQKTLDTCTREPSLFDA